MGKVVTGASVSLDGYIAGPEETGFEHLFAWYGAGDVEFSEHSPRDPVCPVGDGSCVPEDRCRPDWCARCRSTAVRHHRRLGWHHPLDRPIVVVTHNVPEQWVQSHPGAPCPDSLVKPAIRRQRCPTHRTRSIAQSSHCDARPRRVTRRPPDRGAAGSVASAGVVRGLALSSAATIVGLTFALSPSAPPSTEPPAGTSAEAPTDAAPDAGRRRAAPARGHPGLRAQARRARLRPVSRHRARHRVGPLLVHRTVEPGR